MERQTSEAISSNLTIDPLRDMEDKATDERNEDDDKESHTSTTPDAHEETDN